MLYTEQQIIDESWPWIIDWVITFMSKPQYIMKAYSIQDNEQSFFCDLPIFNRKTLILDTGSLFCIHNSVSLLDTLNLIYPKMFIFYISSVCCVFTHIFKWKVYKMTIGINNLLYKPVACMNNHLKYRANILWSDTMHDESRCIIRPEIVLTLMKTIPEHCNQLAMHIHLGTTSISTKLIENIIHLLSAWLKWQLRHRVTQITKLNNSKKG